MDVYSRHVFAHHAPCMRKPTEQEATDDDFR